MATTDPFAAALNLCAKAARRVRGLHKPVVRYARRRGREREHRAVVAGVRAIERELARVAAGSGPVVAGPWLAEVGYEVLYWVPFLRWAQDRFGITPDRLVVVSRGGGEWWYRGRASRYRDIFDHMTPEELTALNDERRRTDEGGGRKQSGFGELDRRLLDLACGRNAYDPSAVLHPSLLFRLFRDVWHGNLPLDDLWTRTEYARLERPPRPDVAGLPAEYVAVRVYSGTALPDTMETRQMLRALVRRMAERLPVVLLDTRHRFDEHEGYSFDDLPNVISARPWMNARTNLGLQTALIANARYFVGTCGGLAWLAPFLDVPTVALYADASMLAPHLLVARQAGRHVDAAPFMPIDVRALEPLGARLWP